MPEIEIETQTETAQTSSIFVVVVVVVIGLLQSLIIYQAAFPQQGQRMQSGVKSLLRTKTRTRKPSQKLFAAISAGMLKDK